MKTLLTTALLTISLFTQAQITITEADLPVVDDTFRLSTALDPQIDYATTGANQTWDYSYLEAISQDIDTIFPVDFTPFAYQLLFDNGIIYPDHKADYATRGIEFDLLGQLTLEDVYNFTQVDSNSLRTVGFGARINGIPAPIQYDSIEVVYDFPVNYGNIDSSNFLFGQGVPSVGYYGATGTRYNEVDGWGTLITPFGTFDALRIKSEIVRTDTFYLDLVGFGFNFPNNSTEYKWLGVGSGVPLLTIITNDGFGGEMVQSIEYQDSIRPTILNIDELALGNAFTVYPNPANNEVRIAQSNDVQVKAIEIIDAQGRIVRTNASANSNHDVVFEVSDIARGTYFVRIVTEKGLVHKPLVIAH